MILFFYNFCQFSSGALLVDIRLIQKQCFYLVKETGGAQKILQQIVHSKLFYSFSLLLEMIFFVYIFYQFSSRALLVDISLIQKQSFYLVEKIREAKKVSQQIVHSKLFHSFSLLLEMIFFYYIFCQFSSRALLVNISLIQKQSFYLVKKIGEVQKISQQIVLSKLFYYLPPVIQHDLNFL